jgi:hypothetical protein
VGLPGASSYRAHDGRLSLSFPPPFSLFLSLSVSPASPHTHRSSRRRCRIPSDQSSRVGSKRSKLCCDLRCEAETWDRGPVAGGQVGRRVFSGRMTGGGGGIGRLESERVGVERGERRRAGALLRPRRQEEGRPAAAAPPRAHGLVADHLPPGLQRRRLPLRLSRRRCRRRPGAAHRRGWAGGGGLSRACRPGGELRAEAALGGRRAA